MVRKTPSAKRSTDGHETSRRGWGVTPWAFSARIPLAPQNFGRPKAHSRSVSFPKQPAAIGSSCAIWPEGRARWLVLPAWACIALAG